MHAPFIDKIIRLALLEDIGHGDITSLSIVPEDRNSKAVFRAKEAFVLAGMPFVKRVFAAIDSSIIVEVFVDEGAEVNNGAELAMVSGNARGVLAGERTALNILQRISGIATLTRAFKKMVSDLPVKLVDTRKTAPGMRYMEKYGVRRGGGDNHRFGLYDGVLIKDNHIMLAGGVAAAIGLVRHAHHLLKIEVEVKTLDQVKEAIDAGADIVMLDNMPLETLAKAVALGRGVVLMEASGNVSVDTVRKIAETGVDLISIGALTHSARAVDISMKIISD